MILTQKDRSSPNLVLHCSLNGETSRGLREKLRSSGITLLEVSSLHEAERELLVKRHSLVVFRADTVSSALAELLLFIHRNNLPTRLIASLQSGSVDDAVHLMKAGAADFIVSKIESNRLVDAIQRNSIYVPDGELKNAAEDIALVGKSSAISEIRSAIDLIARSQTTALISGESGTGKEVVARIIHNRSKRKDKPFIAVNCAALPKDVIENELFGHERGAFTGSLQKKEGYFEMADQGTIFFDEIAEMSIETQAKLLRAIELQKFRRLGGKEEITVDVRIIAATNKNLKKALESGELREDLYYRLSVIEFVIPPLRERKEDIRPLVDHFLSTFCRMYARSPQRFADDSLEILSSYDWPGNVRELRNIVERAVVVCSQDIIEPRFLPERIAADHSVRSHIQIPVGVTSEEAERMVILHTLAALGQNKSKAAKVLGLSRKTLHNKLARFGQQVPDQTPVGESHLTV